MLKDIKIYTSDSYWIHIFECLGFELVKEIKFADVNFDDIKPNNPISVLELEEILIDTINNNDVVKKVLGSDIFLPRLQSKIINVLFYNKEISLNDLKNKLGINKNLTSHTVENAIYQLRKIYGHNLIINKNGLYKLGCL